MYFVFLMSLFLVFCSGFECQADDKMDLSIPAAVSAESVPKVKDYKFYIARAEVFRSKGDLAKAISDYNKALELNPEFKQIYSLRGLAYLMENKYPEALADMDHAILDNQDVEQNYNNRCYCLDKLGKYDQALTDCNNAIALDPDVADTYDTRAAVYLHKKDYDKSWANIRKVNSLGATPSADTLNELKKESGRNEG